MANEDTNRIALTRRQLIGGLATIGAAGAGAGMGTAALFSDEESFTGNSITAGTLDMQVTADTYARSPELPTVEYDNGSTANGAAVTITLNDIKPGDWVIIRWEIVLSGNPGYVQLSTANLSNKEGATPESETDTSSPGDLGDALLTTCWQQYDETLSNGRSLLLGLKGATDNSGGTDRSFYYETPNEDGITAPSGKHYTTLNEAHANLQSGMVLTETSSSDPLEVEPGQIQDGNGAVRYTLFEIPPSVGNEIQGDIVEFDVVFETEQVRNNPNPF